MRLHQTPLLIASLLLCIGSPSGLSAHHSSPTFCGNLHIRYPFCLKSDKLTCGDRRYELTCEGNRTTINIYSVKYYVKSISYSPGDQYIKITNVGLASGGCALPSDTLSLYTNWHHVERFSGPSYAEVIFDTLSLYTNRYHEERLSGPFYDGVIFVNCTREIQSPYRPRGLEEYSLTEIRYNPVPCLSGSNVYVYFIVFDMGNDDVGHLAPSCRILAMVPTDVSYVGVVVTEADVFEHLQNGFSLEWVNLSCDPVPVIVKRCYQRILRAQLYTGIWELDIFNMLIGPFETHFFWCLDEQPGCQFNSVIFLLIKGFIVLIHALSLLALARILVRLVLSILAVFALLVYKYREMQGPEDAVENFLISQQSLTPTRYAYTDIIVITRNFKDKIGQGGFGSVYKGKLPSGFQVAVKILGNSKCDGDDFISEVSTIGRIHHINIVHLVGFCSEGSKRALVYEYLPKGSLDKYIFSSEPANQHLFTLDKLIDIALGIARGIDYLHQGCDMRILHFDIKPQNILLDNCFSPKVSDFGLAKLFPKDYSLVALSVARGTIGYIAPELVSRSFGIISYKSDVYSFGMLLMEMAGGRRNVEPKAENTSQIYYPSWIYDQLDDQRDLHGIVRDVAAIGEIERKLSIVGLWCIQTRPSQRPSMSRVIEMLQAEVGTLQMPPKPFLSAERVCSLSIRNPSTEASSSTLTVISEQESLI